MYEVHVNIAEIRKMVGWIRDHQNEAALNLLENLISLGRVTLEEIGVTQAEYDGFRKFVDIAAAKGNVDRIRDHQNGASLNLLEASISSGRVTLEEIGVTQVEYDGFRKLVDIADAREKADWIRDDLNEAAFQILEDLLSSGRVTLEEIGVIRAEYDELHRLIKSHTT